MTRDSNHLSAVSPASQIQASELTDMTEIVKTTIQEPWSKMTWRNRATCLGEDPELFFPIGSTGLRVSRSKRHKAICRRCEVIDTCLRWADTMESGADTGDWGGLSDEERRSLKRRRARARVLSLVVGGQGVGKEILALTDADQDPGFPSRQGARPLVPNQPRSWLGSCAAERPAERSRRFPLDAKGVPEPSAPPR